MLGPFPPLETSFGGTDLHALFRCFFQNTFFKKKSWRTLKITLCRYRLTILETGKLHLKLNLYDQDFIALCFVFIIKLPRSKQSIVKNEPGIKMRNKRRLLPGNVVLQFSFYFDLYMVI